MELPFLLTRCCPACFKAISYSLGKAQNMNEEQNNLSDDSEIPENAESLIFAKIVRYMAEQLAKIDPEAMPEDIAIMSELFGEIASAFESTNGFEYSHEQALPLSHAFAMLEGGIRLLGEQASEGGHTNAAAKMQWAALKAKTMTADLETSHLEGAGGIIAFKVGSDIDADNDDEIPSGKIIH